MAAATKIVVEFLGKDSTAPAAKAVAARFGTLGTRLDKVGQAAGKTLKLGLLAGAAAAVKFGNAAADDAEAADRLAVTLKNTTNATKPQIAANEKWITAMGRSKAIADTELRPALGRLVTATKDVGEAQSLAKLAMDVSAGTGKNLETVSFALAKAHNGNVAALGRLGLKTKDSEGKALSYKKVIANLSDTFKGQADAAADSQAGKQRKLGVAYDELQEKIGTKVLPVLQKLTDVGMKVVDWIDRNQKTAGILAASFAGLLAVTYAVSLALRVAAAGSAIWTAATKLSAIYTGLNTAWIWALNIANKAYVIGVYAAAIAQRILNAAMRANPIGLIITALVLLGAGLVLAYQKSETFRKIVDAAFRFVQKAAAFAFNWIKSHWRLLLTIVAGPIGLAVALVTKHWGTIKKGAQAAIKFITSKFDGFISFAKKLPGRMGKALRGLFDGIKSAFRSAINWVIGKWNGLSFKIPSVNTHIPGVGRVGGMTISTPNIPRVASGGIVRARPGGILANIGEGGHDEAIVPLSGPHAPKMGGDTYITINGALDPGAVAKQVQQILLKRKREVGTDLGLA